MNKNKLKKSLFHRVRLCPCPQRRNSLQRSELIDDIWIIEKVENNYVELSNTRTGHVAQLGHDAIHHYDNDPQSNWDGLKHGFLVLNVKLTLNGNKVEIEPSNSIHR